MWHTLYCGDGALHFPSLQGRKEKNTQHDPTEHTKCEFYWIHKESFCWHNCINLYIFWGVFWSWLKEMVLLHPSFSFIPYQITKKKNKTKKKIVSCLQQRTADFWANSTCRMLDVMQFRDFFGIWSEYWWGYILYPSWQLKANIFSGGKYILKKKFTCLIVNYISIK